MSDEGGGDSYCFPKPGITQEARITWPLVKSLRDYVDYTKSGRYHDLGLDAGLHQKERVS